MAKYVFDANKYPNGTLLSDFGIWDSGYSPKSDFEVAEIGSTGRKYWTPVAGISGASVMTTKVAHTDFDLLLLCDFTAAETGTTNHGHSIYHRCPALTVNTFPLELWRYVVNGSEVVNSYSGTSGMTATKNIAPTGVLSTKANGLRYTFTGQNTIKLRMWAADVGGLEAAEPADWVFEATLTTPASSSPNLHPYGLNRHISSISLGTDGDAAAYPDPNQTVTTPSGLSVANIAATTADVDWT